MARRSLTQADLSTRTTKARDPHGIDSSAPAEDSGPAANSIDSEENRKLLARLKSWLQGERDRQRDNRVEMATDEDYYDNIQWTEEEIAILAARGQRPAVVNEIAPAIDWVLGTERRTRVDWKILPRGPEDQGGSMVLSTLAKFVSDVNKAAFVRSNAFAQAVKCGLGWIEIGARNDWEDDPLFVRVEDWRNCWHDSTARELDGGDSRYFFRARVVDLDIAIKKFPAREAQLRACAHDVANIPSAEDEYDSNLSSGYRSPLDAGDEGARLVVRLIEAWYRDPGEVKMLRGGRYSGRTFDPSNPFHQKVIDQGLSSLFDSVQMVVKFACFIDRGDLLTSRDTPYTHNRFPFIPVWAKRRGRDGMPYGIIRGQRDSQDGLNKRRSKQEWLLATNRVIMDQGAVDDVEDMREEVSRPDAIIEKVAGKELRIENNLSLADAHIRIEERDAAYIRQTSGVTGENLGLSTNATSGKAIIARQEQGNVVLAPLFDNMRLAWQIGGEILISLIGQFYTDERIIRIGIKQDSEESEFLEINHWDEETGEFNNDITATMADFIVSEQDYRDSLRQAMHESLMEVIGRLPPEMAVRMLDIAVSMSDLPEKEALLQKIRDMEPSNAPPPPDPVALAQANKINADAALAKAKTAGEKLKTIKDALEASGALQANPALAAITDDLMREAGPITDIPVAEPAAPPPVPPAMPPQDGVAPPIPPQESV